MGVREEEKLYSERERNHGVRNRATICFASTEAVRLRCILQYLFNQQLFRKGIEDVEVSHVPACKDCRQGPVRVYYS